MRYYEDLVRSAQDRKQFWIIIAQLLEEDDVTCDGDCVKRVSSPHKIMWLIGSEKRTSQGADSLTFDQWNCSESNV